MFFEKIFSANPVDRKANASNDNEIHRVRALKKLHVDFVEHKSAQNQDKSTLDCTDKWNDSYYSSVVLENQRIE